MKIPFSTRWRVLQRAAIGLFNDAAYDDDSSGLLGGVIGPQGTPPTRGTEQMLNGYKDYPWVRAIAGKIAYTFAATEWQLFVPQREGRAERRAGWQRIANPVTRTAFLARKKEVGELREIESDHPLLTALNTANTFQTGLGLRKLFCLYLDLVGDVFAYKQRNAVGAVVGLWPIPPHWVTSTPSLSHPTYTVSYRGWNRELRDEDVLWMHDPDPVNPYGRGVGHSQAVSDELETDEYAALMIKQVFFNRARPDLLVSPKEGTLMADEVDRLEHKWNSRLQGFHRVMKPFFVRKAIDVKEFSHNFQNLQMKDLRDQQRDIVMQVFGIPPEIMGVLTSSNRATIEAADFLFTKYVVVPRLEFFREQLQQKLVPEYDERLILSYDSPVQEDKEMQLKAMQMAPWTVRVNEWRTVQGLEDLEGPDGDLFMRPFNADFSPTLEGTSLAGLAGSPTALPGDELDDDEGDDAEGEETQRGTFHPSRLKTLSTQQLKEMRRLVELVRGEG